MPLLCLSRISNSLQVYEGREPLFIYGDPAYHNSAGILRPFPARGMTPQRHRFNVDMSRARIAVENGFGKVSSLWQTNQLTNKLQSGNSPVAAYYIVAVLLTNIHTCMRGVRTPFGLQPPYIEDYLQPELGKCPFVPFASLPPFAGRSASRGSIVLSVWPRSSPRSSRFANHPN